MMGNYHVRCGAGEKIAIISKSYLSLFTDIQELVKTQMIVSLVIKYNPLEILYDYTDVLERKKKSLDREIEEKSNFVIAQVA